MNSLVSSSPGRAEGPGCARTTKGRAIWPCKVASRDCHIAFQVIISLVFRIATSSVESGDAANQKARSWAFPWVRTLQRARSHPRIRDWGSAPERSCPRPAILPYHRRDLKRRLTRRAVVSMENKRSASESRSTDWPPGAPLGGASNSSVPRPPSIGFPSLS